MKYIINFIILPMIVLAFGCAHVEHRTDQNSQISKELITQINDYLQTRDDGDLIKVYSFFSPGYKKKNKLTTFVQRYNLEYSNSHLIDLTEQEKNATAKVESDVKLLGVSLKNFKQTIRWILIEKKWYIDPSKK